MINYEIAMFLITYAVALGELASPAGYSKSLHQSQGFVE